ncbi:MAG: hypothetical protein EOO05_12250 [Chitinophagaceae bacterium]|nr:MAG: hypothetical protein EOO05_12250 [Chitinophagaceae bacterium]
MTPRSLFVIILKVLGILLLQQLVTQMMQLVAIVISSFTDYDASMGFMSLFITVASLLLVLGIAYWLIFKPDELVSKFSLDKHFAESTFQLNISSESIIHIALIVVAFLILLGEIPYIIRDIYSTMNQNEFYTTVKPDWSPVIFSAIRIIIAFLLIGERKRIVPFLLRKQSEASGMLTEENTSTHLVVPETKEDEHQ